MGPIAKILKKQLTGHVYRSTFYYFYPKITHMPLLRQVPNLISLLNLLCGVLAVIFAVHNNLAIAALFVLAGIFFDFFDGLAARLLGVQGDLGKQLDSLADVVTSGVAPGIVMFQLLGGDQADFFTTAFSDEGNLLPFLGLLIPLSAAYRLANFNIDARQSTSFIGLPTPAAALLVVSLPLISTYQPTASLQGLIDSNWFLIAVTLLVVHLMNAPLALFSLKFQHFTWKDNRLKGIFLLCSLCALCLWQLIAIPVIIVGYILLSVLGNYWPVKK